MTSQTSEGGRESAPAPSGRGTKTVRLCGLLALAVAAVFGRLVYTDLESWCDGAAEYLLHPGTITTAALVVIALVAVVTAGARSLVLLAAAAAAAGMYNLLAGAFQSVGYNEPLGPWRLVMATAVLLWSAWLAAVVYPDVAANR